MRACLSSLFLALLVLLTAAGATELATFEIAEPLGRTWTDDWLTQGGALDTGDHAAKVATLQLTTAEGAVLPAQFYRAEDGSLLADGDEIRGKARLRILFKATITKRRKKTDEPAAFVLTDGRKRAHPWTPVSIAAGRDGVTVANGIYSMRFRQGSLRPFDALTACGSIHWPDGVKATGVRDRWLERGPARAILKRAFTFASPKLRYEIAFDFRAADPWIDIVDTYSLGRGSFLKIDLAGLDADVVYHPYAYNARTYGIGGPTEDSTLEPPKHPIATLGPVWRDIWFGGGPFAFLYRKGADHGIGFAAVRGSEWTTPDGIRPESQNLEVHGDRKTPGKVWVKLPTDGGRRRWAIVVGPPEVRKRMGGHVRRRADVPLDMVLKEWVLDWPSDAPAHPYGFAGQWLGHFNQHSLNPTTFPRRVRSHLNGLLKKGAKVKSRDLAVLAYAFTNPNYWPGPRYKWRIGNPNFHTDMYNVPLKIGLLMPDHPHAKRWLQYGVDETRGNLMRDSFPRGAWAESLGYSGFFFFHVVDNAKALRDAGIVAPFRQWPRFKEVAAYLACMHTPVDPRYGSRQKAPIGDTSPGNYVQRLRAMADLYRGIDDAFARRLARFPDKGPDALDLRSREFFGFGAMLRGSPYDDRHESFVTIKAGPARNHFQADELSFHFCALGTPLAIDHACHYSPRPWSASMHNRPDMNGKRPITLAARRAMAVSPAADVFVADERTRRISHLPLAPHHTTKPGWEYAVTLLPKDKPWTMRRYAMLVKHDPKSSRIPDYLVLRDEIDSPEPVWWNLHVLARDMQRDGARFRFPGQWLASRRLRVLREGAAGRAPERPCCPDGRLAPASGFTRPSRRSATCGRRRGLRERALRPHRPAGLPARHLG